MIQFLIEMVIYLDGEIKRTTWDKEWKSYEPEENVAYHRMCEWLRAKYLGYLQAEMEC